jgi:Fic family protein
MSKVLKRRWQSDLGDSGIPRRDRAPCDYEAYVPDPLVGRKIVLDGEVAADVADAEAAITRLNAEARAPVDTEALARILLRAEAVASSRIEGLEVGARRLLHAEVVRGLREASSDVTATEVLANIDAMVYGVEAVGPGSPITVDVLLEVHRRLLSGTRLEQHGGRFREEQNWIGGSGYNPCSAAFVPPPHELVEDLMADLCAFSSTDVLPAVAQAAIAHAQFETIHPFVDGNGRTGRALIHLILRRRGLAVRVLPPISLVLATWAQSYTDGLTQFRFVGAPTARQAVEGLNTWVERFAGACTRSVADATTFEERTTYLEQQWRERLGTIRANSATDLLLRSLPGAPILTADRAAALIGRTFKPAADAIHRLVDADILRQVTVGRRNRAFEAPEVIAAFTDLERQLASPEGDTRTSEPTRRVPRRRQGSLNVCPCGTAARPRTRSWLTLAFPITSARRDAVTPWP